MEKIERYLDGVCRRLGGPRAMRSHVRQELREHLLDAVEVLRADGMTEEEAAAKALEDFGGLAEVRGGLEEAHGHRVTAVLVEKAMQWKEQTMKTRWLWMTLVHVVVSTMILLEVLFIFGLMLFIFPKFNQMASKGWMVPQDPSAEWLLPRSRSFFAGLAWCCANPLWLLMPLVVLWTLFEWRVKSDNKTWIRLLMLGILAMKLFIVVALSAAAMILPLMVYWPKR